jgi:sugar phosphate permease
MAPPAPAIASQTRIPGPLWRVLILLVLSVAINYIDRGNLSIAAPLLKDELGISATQLGSLLSAFFWTYGEYFLMGSGPTGSMRRRLSGQVLAYRDSP